MTENPPALVAAFVHATYVRCDEQTQTTPGRGVTRTESWRVHSEPRPALTPFNYTHCEVNLDIEGELTVSEARALAATLIEACDWLDEQVSS